MIEWAGSVISDGTDRRARIAPALQAGYFDVDELAFEQLLAMGAAFAAQVRFYNLSNQPEGDWSGLFHADEAVIMAMVLSTDLKRLESAFLSRLPGPLESLAEFVLQCARRIDFWLAKLEGTGHHSGSDLHRRLVTMVEEKLAPELHNLGRVVAQLELEARAGQGVDLAAFGHAWGIQTDGENLTFPRATLDSSLDGETGRQCLRNAFYVFYNAISYLKTITPLYLQQSLGSGRHEPALGLYLAFIRLYETAQRRINRFSQRHLDFYYRQVLQARPRAAVPESTHLLFQVQAGVPAFVIEKGRAFSAGKDARLNDIVYRADTELWLRQAEVAALYTLNLQQDALIAPESDLGYVTRIKAQRPALPEGQAQTQAPPAWPLFGRLGHGAAKGRADDAEIGFSLASPLLRLHAGRRRIEVDIALEDRVAVDAETMTGMLGRCHDRASFAKLFGRLFSRYLLAHQGWLSADHKARIITVARSLLDSRSAKEIANLLLQDWQGLFYKLLGGMFRIELTTALGWHEVQDYLIRPRDPGEGDAVYGLTLSLSLGPEVEPVVPYAAALHGPGLSAEQPVLRCRIHPQTHFYPYSLFNDLMIKWLDLEVAVQGLNDIQLYNNHGQLDPSKPFAPFGPMPGRNAFLIFGNYELAQKRLTELCLNLEWGELPTRKDGFAAHYRGYEGDYGNDSFKARFQVLADGHWQPREPDEQQRVGLFDTEQEGGQPRAERCLQVNVLDYAKPVSASVGADEYAFELGSRNGFFRLALSDPEGAFGHGEYPPLLSRVLAENARRKKPEPVPNPPYTPVLNKISLDYRAHSRLHPGVDSRAGQLRRGEALFHHHPFGVAPVYPRDGARSPYLLPQYQSPGNLFIGLSGRDLAGRVTLFFHLAEDHAQEVAGDPPQVSWFYLCCDQWKPLPATRVVMDTTHGFLASGVITLDIPADINRDNRVMPVGLYWLRVCAQGNLQGVCSAYAVHTNAVQVTRQPEQGQTAAPVQVKWQAMAAIPGVGAIRHIGATFGGRVEEDETAFRTRLSERLRHKNRASLPWDYERLILQHFPEVAKVKCFAHMVSSRQTPAPGHVLVVVVPETSSSQRIRANARAMLSSIELSRIRDLLQRHSSSFVKLEVRNPAYEQVQVRCTVKFSAGMSDAAGIKRLDDELSAYLSPWVAGGYQARFGWSIRQRDVESYIWERDYVEFVTNVSMLHITVDGAGLYRLDDTARVQANEDIRIRPRFPWSLALPAQHHFIETTVSLQPIEAEVTGVDELEIGNTFIISGNGEHGEEE